jgi:hypothetical protein
VSAISGNTHGDVVICKGRSPYQRAGGPPPKATFPIFPLFGQL